MSDAEIIPPYHLGFRQTNEIYIRGNMYCNIKFFKFFLLNSKNQKL